jgi:hypothetical protein
MKAGLLRKGDTPETNGPVFFDRTFEPYETKEITIYGLDGEDIFQVTGQGGTHSIVVGVIGGSGKDYIANHSRASSLRRFTKVYDTPSTDLAGGPETDRHISISRTVNLYDCEGFEYNSYTPHLAIATASAATQARISTQNCALPWGRVKTIFYPSITAGSASATRAECTTKAPRRVAGTRATAAFTWRRWPSHWPCWYLTRCRRRTASYSLGWVSASINKLNNE